MKLGDRGPEVLAFQQSVFPTNMCDGICGLDTFSRWRADNDPTCPWQLRNMFRLIGKITTYSMANVTDTADDCSGSVCLALGISKAHGTATNPTPLDFGTDGILADARGDEHVFTTISTDTMQPGDLLCYGRHDGHAGHVAFWLGDGNICDCSASENGVHAHKDTLAQFLVPHAGRPVYALRFVGPRSV